MATRRRATLADVARLAQVSIATASNTLNAHPHVDARTRARVEAAVQALGYTPNLAARGLRTGRAGCIGIFSSMPFAIAGGRAQMGFLMEIAAAAAARALQSGIALILIPPLESGRPPLASLPIDGALVVEPEQGDEDVARLRGQGIPVVGLGRQPGAAAMPHVDLQSAAGTQVLLRHLQGQGCRRIALVVGRARRNSYPEAVEEYGRFVVEADMPSQIVRLDEAGGTNAAQTVIATLLETTPEIDGLCVMVDAFAVGAVQAAVELGRDIPASLKLATRYDGLLARECRPPLTALNLHLETVAALGVELLLDQIAGNPGAIRIPPPPQLVPRASSIAGR
jgi:DNA-binding LacI/PurR family transcriptional regulator